MIDALISCDGRDGLAPFALLLVVALLVWRHLGWLLDEKKDPNAP